MSTITVTSARNTSTGPSFTVDNSLRDASFSSYLVEKDSAPKVRNSAEDIPYALSNTTEHIYRLSLGPRRDSQDGEISVFDADKYFKGELDDEEIHNTKLKSRFQNALFPICPDGHDQTREKCGKRFFHGLSCSCSGKKSVEVDERAIGKSSNNCRRVAALRSLHYGDHHVMGKQPLMSTLNKQDDCFSFPVLNPLTRNSSAGAMSQEEEKPRVSIEVFGSPPMGKLDMDPSKHRRLLMTSLVDFGKNRMGDTTPFSLCSTPNAIDDDIASDSSSDLFEIQSLSPRHASISQKPPNPESNSTATTTLSAALHQTVGELKSPRRKAYSLLNCQSCKAVDVANDLRTFCKTFSNRS